MTRRIAGPPLLTRAEAAQVLGVHPSTVTRWAAAGLLPCVRTPSGERRYRSRDVEELLNQRPNAGRILDDATTRPAGLGVIADPAGGQAPCQRPATTAAGPRRVSARSQRPR